MQHVKLQLLISTQVRRMLADDLQCLLLPMKFMCDAASRITNGTFNPSPNWASKFMMKHGWHSIATHRRDPSEVRSTMHGEVDDHVELVNTTMKSFNLGPVVSMVLR